MIGNGREADGAEIDRIVGAQLLDAVLGHHAARLEVALARPIKLLPDELEAVLLSGGF